MEMVWISVSGMSQGDPGPAAIGVVLTNAQGEVLGEMVESIGNATGDYAAYVAVAKGLQATVDLLGEKTSEMEFELRIDNKTVKEQLSAQAQVNHPGLVPYFIEVHNLRVQHFPRLRPVYVSLKKNLIATQLVNNLLDG